MSVLAASRSLRVRRGFLVLLLALSLGVLAACAAGAHAASAGAQAPPAGRAAPAATQVTVTETEFSISMPQALTAGSYTFAIRNVGASTHDLVVSQNGRVVAASAIVAPGGTAAVSATLQPGTYVFYCSIDGHRARGMELTVRVS